MYKAPGRSERTGITLFQLLGMLPDEEAAQRWFEARRWPTGERACPKCGCMRTSRVESRKPMPFWCRDCRSYFSLKTGTVMSDSNLSLRTWALGMYLMATNLKGVSSMKLHRDLGVSQPTAWFMAQRLREGLPFATEKMEGIVEVDETYVGGKESNKHFRKKLHVVGGTQGKATVMGAKERGGKVFARPLGWEPGETLAGFVHETVEAGETVYTDDHGAYRSLKNTYRHASVKHSRST